MDTLEKIRLVDSLIKDAGEMTSNNTSSVHSRAKMIVRKIFNENSDYLKEIDNISYNPPLFTTDSPNSYFQKFFDYGKNDLLSLLKVIKEDVELSSKEVSEH